MLDISSLVDVELIGYLLLALIGLGAVLLMVGSFGGCIRGVRQGFLNARNGTGRPGCGCINGCKLLLRPNTQQSRNFVSRPRGHTTTLLQVTTPPLTLFLAALLMRE